MITALVNYAVGVLVHMVIFCCGESKYRIMMATTSVIYLVGGKIFLGIGLYAFRCLKSITAHLKSAPMGGLKTGQPSGRPR